MTNHHSLEPIQDITAIASAADGLSPSASSGKDAEIRIAPEMLQQVDVKTEALEGRQRKISAKIQIPYPAEQIWQILTDYETLADFIPNLAKSRRLEHPDGKIRIEQIGSQCLLNFQFCARVVLDMAEIFPHRIDFQMVEGDFKAFEGSWHLQPVDFSNPSETELIYTVLVWPKRLMPIQLIERHLNHNLRVNLVSIREQSERLFGASSRS